MADQKAGPGKGSVFIPPPTAEQIAAARQARTIRMQIGRPLPEAGQQPGPSSSQQPVEPQRPLKKTLLGLPAVAPPAHKAEGVDSAALWASAGLSAKKKEKKEEPKKEEEVFDRLMEFRRKIAPGAVEMANFVMLQMEGEFRSLVASERLQPICSGGRATLEAEKPVAESIGKIRDEVYRRFGEDKRLRPFLRGFAETVLSSAPVTEKEGKTETEMRNGFYRAAAWCLCSHNDQEQFISYMLKNHISLIDGVGIAAGLSTADSISESFSTHIISMLLERKWVSLAFYHLQDMLMADFARLDEAERKGMAGEGLLDRICEKMDAYLMILFREVDNYQTLGQRYTRLAMLMSNLMQRREKEVPLMYIAPSEFYSLIISRQMPVTKVWEDLGHTHKFIAERMADREGQASRYVVGLRPKDIAQRFFTILEAVDFLTGNPKIKGFALKMIKDLHAPFSTAPGRNESFRKALTLALFTEKEDLQNHSHLFSTLEDHADPIISLRASEHKAMLLSRKKAASAGSDDPFVNIPDGDFF